MSVGRASEGAEREQAIDLARLVAGIRRRRRWVVWPTILALAGLDRFRSRCRVRATPASPRSCSRIRRAISPSRTRRRGWILRPTIDQEAVQSQAEAVAIGRPRAQGDRQTRTRDEPRVQPRIATARSDQRLVDKFLSRLTVFPVPRSRVLQIEFVSRDPDARRPRRQHGRRGLPAVPDRGEGERCADRQRLALGQDRGAARQSRRRRRKGGGRSAPGSGLSGRRERTDGPGPATLGAQRAARQRPVSRGSRDRQGRAPAAARD